MERDLIALGKDDEFDAGLLSVAKLGSIVLAAPPGTAVHHALTARGVDHLTDSQRSQLMALAQQRQARRADASVSAAAQEKPNRIDNWDSMPLEEFERLRAANYAKGESPGRVIGPEKKASTT